MNKLFKDNGKFDELKKEVLSRKEFQGLDIPDYMIFPIINYYEDKKKCEKCKSLSNCKQRSVGYCPVLDLKNKQVTYKECKYKQDELLRLKTNSMIKAWYLPQKILEASLDDFYHEKTETTIKQYSNGEVGKLDIKKLNETRRDCLSYATKFISDIKNQIYSKGMYLYGGFGSGKTYLLAAIGNELAKENIECLLVYFPDLVRDLKSDFDKINDKINMIRNVQVLMIDDIGSEVMTSWVRDEILGPILQYRVLDMKPTFFSSNLNNAKLLEHLSIDNDKTKGGRIAKRINDLCEFKKLED